MFPLQRVHVIVKSKVKVNSGRSFKNDLYIPHMDRGSLTTPECRLIQTELMKVESRVETESRRVRVTL